MDPMSQMFQWLRKKERQQGIKDPDTAQLFIDNSKELKQQADAIRRQDPNAASRVEVMSGGEVLGTALIAWLRLKEEGDNIGLARKVVEVVWPRVCSGRAQIHPDWTVSCGTKMDLIQEIESWVRMNSARRERHLIKLGNCCPECQHGLCTAMSKCLLHCTAASRTDARQRGEGRCWRPCTPCIGSFGAGAGRCPPALLASAPLALVRADARPPALLASARWCRQTLRCLFFFAAPPAALASSRTRRLLAPPPALHACSENLSSGSTF